MPVERASAFVGDAAVNEANPGPPCEAQSLWTGSPENLYSRRRSSGGSTRGRHTSRQATLHSHLAGNLARGNAIQIPPEHVDFGCPHERYAFVVDMDDNIGVPRTPTAFGWSRSRRTSAITSGSLTKASMEARSWGFRTPPTASQKAPLGIHASCEAYNVSAKSYYKVFSSSSTPNNPRICLFHLPAASISLLARSRRALSPGKPA